ncbi:MAG: hypothetical protein GX921_00735 [Bacteroidales bacterium]|nr:hypothetical protein [Bacteroidales bacterium]
MEQELHASQGKNCTLKSINRSRRFAIINPPMSAVSSELAQIFIRAIARSIAARANFLIGLPHEIGVIISLGCAVYAEGMYSLFL